MKKILLITGFLITFLSPGFAQLSDYALDDETALRVFFYQGIVTNSWDGKTTDDLVVSRWGVHIGFAKSNFDLGKIQRSHRLPIMGDLLIPALIDPLVNNGTLEGQDGNPILSSLVGWHNYAVSFLSNDKLQIAAGAHLGDYLYGVDPIESERYDDRNVDGSMYHYWTAGPAVIADLHLGVAGLMLHYEGAYAFTFGKEPHDPELDQKPTLINQTLELRWKKVFLNLELVNGLNTTGNKLNRTQVGLGISF
ncbi:MAG: hypothetical protein AAFO69_11350 [Bacteroidota bacterium]